MQLGVICTPRLPMKRALLLLAVIAGAYLGTVGFLSSSIAQKNLTAMKVRSTLAPWDAEPLLLQGLMLSTQAVRVLAGDNLRVSRPSDRQNAEADKLLLAAIDVLSRAIDHRNCPSACKTLAYDGRGSAHFLRRSQNKESFKFAVDDFSRAIDADPQDPSPRIHRAEAYLEVVGGEEEALADLEVALRSDRDNPVAVRLFSEFADRKERRRSGLITPRR
jgi:tetratricopeptide (TPR) repeat protein